MLEAITSSFVASVILGLTQRSVASPLHRARTLRLAILRSKSRSELSTGMQNFNRALDDFVLFLGNYKGQYTKNLANLVRTLESDPHAIALYEAIVLNKETSHFLNYFQALYLTTIPDSDHKAAEEFFHDFTTVLSSSLDVRRVRPRLDEFDSVLLRHLVKKLDRIEELSSFVKVDSINLFEKDFTKLTQTASRLYSRLLVPTIHANRTVDLNQIFVPGRLSPLNRVSSGPVYRSRDVLRKPEPQALNPVERLLTQRDKCVILGDPGGGKSTLGQSICTSVASSAQFLPIRIRLRDHARKIRTSSWNVLDSIREEITTSFEDSRPDHDFFLHMLSLGRLFIFFDGLDEIINADERRYVANRIDNFSDKYPTVPVLVTSRLIGFDDDILPSFKRFILMPFTDEDIQEYVSQYMKNLAKNRIVDTGLLRSYVDQFMVKTQSQARELRDNPLMLSLICGIYDDEHGNIPDNRAKIYELCAKLIYLRWDSMRLIDSSTLQEQDFFNLISIIANAIYPNQSAQVPFTAEWIAERTESFLKDLHLNQSDDFRSKAGKISNELLNRTWVFVPAPDRGFEFAHRTFLEFFFARYVKDTQPNAELLVGDNYKHIIEREWVLPLHLALQLATAGGRLQSDRAAQELCRIYDELDEKGDVSGKVNLTSFSVEALAYLPCGERIFHRVLENAFKELVILGLKRESGPHFQQFLQAADCCPERREFCHQHVEKWLVEGVLEGKNEAPVLACFVSENAMLFDVVKSARDHWLLNS